MPARGCGEISLALAEDTSLVPGIPRRVPVSPGAERFRVRYHSVSEEFEANGDVAPEESVVLLVEGELRR